ncbi:hypothetical protein [Catellatospora sp. NPDC049133]|uniref:hypothetical protein n=1 Tax=Catellatospora sp. NPDC049133 TaxID=3155499 RepID=UPI003401CBC6
MLDLVAGLIGGLLGGGWAERRELRRAEARRAALAAGEPVRVPCGIRDTGAGQTQWRHGDLLITADSMWWTPPGMTTRRIALGPEGLTVHGNRAVSVREGWDVNPSCRILAVRVGERSLELAIPEADLAAVGAVLPPT